MFGAPAFAVGVVVFAFQAGAVSRVLQTAPLRLLGLLSYSIYLTHLFLIERMQDVIEHGERWIGFARIGAYPTGQKFIEATPLVSDLLTGLLLALVIGVSSLTYAFVERPAREWSRRVARRSLAIGGKVASAG